MRQVFGAHIYEKHPKLRNLQVDISDTETADFSPANLKKLLIFYKENN